MLLVKLPHSLAQFVPSNLLHDVTSFQYYVVVPFRVIPL
jgi:hypothetical protein